MEKLEAKRAELDFEYQKHMLFKEHVKTLVEVLKEISPDNLIPSAQQKSATADEEVKRLKHEWVETCLEFCRKIRSLGVKYPIHTMLGIKEPEIETTK